MEISIKLCSVWWQRENLLPSVSALNDWDHDRLAWEVLIALIGRREGGRFVEVTHGYPDPLRCGECMRACKCTVGVSLANLRAFLCSMSKLPAVACIRFPWEAHQTPWRMVFCRVRISGSC